MAELLTIGWAVWLIVAILLVYETAFIGAMVRMFPEGWRWWTTPARHAALAHFALCVLLNPWSRT